MKNNTTVHSSRNRTGLGIVATSMLLVIIVLSIPTLSSSASSGIRRKRKTAAVVVPHDDARQDLSFQEDFLAASTLFDNTISDRELSISSMSMVMAVDEEPSPNNNDKEGEKRTLVATITPPPLTDGIVGTATISYNMDGSFLFSMDMNNLLSQNGTALIAEGTSCVEGDVGFSTTPFFTGDGNQWDGVSNYWTALEEGISASAFRHKNGYGRNQNKGKTVLILDDKKEVVGCGVLEPEVEHQVLVAKMGKYPEYEGELNAHGTVTVVYRPGDLFEMQYDLDGLRPSCQFCGLHIHAGVSCANSGEVLGHGWNSVLVQDLWVTEGGAFYNSTVNGKASGYFQMFNGVSYYLNRDHAVVIHDQDGTRVGCGVLK